MITTSSENDIAKVIPTYSKTSVSSHSNLPKDLRSHIASVSIPESNYAWLRWNRIKKQRMLLFPVGYLLREIPFSFEATTKIIMLPMCNNAIFGKGVTFKGIPLSSNNSTPTGCDPFKPRHGIGNIVKDKKLFEFLLYPALMRREPNRQNCAHTCFLG